MTTDRVTFTSPTDIDFYAGHETEVLERLFIRFRDEGAYVAANSGADHPIAREYASMLAAVAGALLLRDIGTGG